MEDKPVYLSAQLLLNGIVKDAHQWHKPEYALRTFGKKLSENEQFQGITISKSTFAWYGTLRKRVKEYLDAVKDLETLETEQMHLFKFVSETLLSPHKMKQLVIIKLVAELGKTAEELKHTLKSNENVQNAVRLRRRIRWLEIKLGKLTKKPLMTEDDVQFYIEQEYHVASSERHSGIRPSQSPTFVVSASSGGESLYSDEDKDTASERPSSRLSRSPTKMSRPKTPDAVDEYWNSEHHKIEASSLVNSFGNSLPYHLLDIHRSASYVKEKELPPSQFPWEGTPYLDPHSEERALERLSATVQEMMGSAYTAALDSVPDNITSFNDTPRVQHVKFNKPKSGGLLKRIKGQKWMEKKFANRKNANDELVYYPPPDPSPANFTVAKLSDQTFPPLVTSDDCEVMQDRAINMPPRFVNQHDLLKKTHITLYEMIFNSRAESKIDVRKMDRPVKEVKISHGDQGVIASATITRPAPTLENSRPKSPFRDSGPQPSKLKMRVRKMLNNKESNTKANKWPSLKDYSNLNRVFMTKSSWYRTRQVPQPYSYVSTRLSRVQELIAIVSKQSSTVEEKISAVKQIKALGLSNYDVITQLTSLIGDSALRSNSMDVRFEITRLLLSLGFTDGAVLKEMLVFLSSKNSSVLSELLRCLRKALASPRMTEPFGKTFLDTMKMEDKPLNLMYASQTDLLIVHRLIQLCQCNLPELSFYAAACLRKVHLIPPPPPLPPPEPEITEVTDSSSIMLPSESEDANIKAAYVKAMQEYEEKLSKYQALLEDMDRQQKDITKLVGTTFRANLATQSKIVPDALQELIGHLGITEEEIFERAYFVLTNSPVGQERCVMVKLITDGFVKLKDNSPDEYFKRLPKFIELLKDRLINDPIRKVCTECARTFYRLNEYEAMSASVMNNLDIKLDMEVKMNAIKCVVGLHMRGSMVTRALVDLLELDANEGVRIAACRALASLGTTDRRALACLREKNERYLLNTKMNTF